MVSINLIFVDSQKIRQLNKDYRGIDKATTVLSFCYGEEGAGKQVKFPSTLQEAECLGEVIICQSLAKEQGLSIEKLVIHGLKSILSQIPASKNLSARLNRD